MLLAGGAIVVTISVAAVLSQKPGLPDGLGILTLGFGAHVAVLNSFVLMTLYQVLAIPGAGLSPNTGTETIGPLVYLTSLLNLRLDYSIRTFPWAVAASAPHEHATYADVAPAPGVPR